MMLQAVHKLRPFRRIGRIRLMGWLGLIFCQPLFPAEWLEPPPAPDPVRRQAYLDQLLQLLPRSDSWNAWLHQTGELPPDFSVMPDLPRLPDPLLFLNGKKATTGTWPQRRLEMLNLLQYYVTGHIPPSPGNVQATAIRSRAEAGALVDEVVLVFGPENKAYLHMELILPKTEPPFPVVITPQDHRSLALVAVSRGYAACVYAGGETLDDTVAWGEVWPDYDWSTPTRHAWAASRCLDYLQTLPVVNLDQIALAGHGLNAQSALIAAAFDRRFKAVIASCAGPGGASSFRFQSESQFGPGIEPLTRLHPDWVQPRLRFFAGREHKLPVDLPWLMACMAPRSCLLASSTKDPNESIWALEKSYDSARPAYELFKQEHELNLIYRHGGSELQVNDVEGYLDWLDTVFERGFFPFTDVRIFPSYDMWEFIMPEPVDPLTFSTNQVGQLLTLSSGTRVATVPQWEQKREEIRQRVIWSMGVAPSFAESVLKTKNPQGTNRLAVPSGDLVSSNLVRRSFEFGNYLSGDLYHLTNTLPQGQRRPGIIWISPQAAPGYGPMYSQEEPPQRVLARLGFTVLTFDQIGHGSRLEEVKYFYNRYPWWSLAGKQVDDTLAALEALIKSDEADPARIYVVGFGLGGSVALHAAAMDERIAGVVSVAGLMPLRTDPSKRPTRALARWTRWYPWQPRLGAFIGRENRLPYDYEDLLAMTAPRPALVVTPRLDYYADPEEVRACVERGAEIYEKLGAGENLLYLEVEDYRRLSPRMLKLVSNRLKLAAGL